MRIVSIVAVAAALFPWAYAGAAAGTDQNVPSSSSADVTSLDTVVVTGSRIPRARVEGPSPVTVISSEDIKNNGFATVADLMSSVTQNLGELDNNQNTDGFSPGAQAVDLRGLGPNHTLVLVNGRRIADYPQSYGGNSNFTDISAIPASLVDRVEILAGSASAIYGSDAISGVINFIMKQKADGTTVDFRDGADQHGGGASQRLQITSGYSNDRFESVFGLEFYYSRPLWAFQRSFTNSRQDSPDPTAPASPVFVREDADDNYIDPGQATCNNLSYLDRHSVAYQYRENYGNFCGSYRDVGYGTLENGRKQLSLYESATYKINDSMSLFMDLQGAYSHQISYNTPLEWENSYKLNGDSSPIPFYNLATGQVEQWQRRYFTLEENGGLDAGEIQMVDSSLAINTGVRGAFGQSAWSYEALLTYAQNRLENKEPALIAAKAQALYLGQPMGTDPVSGYTEYDAPISRLYTPLTVDQFRSITQDSVDNDVSRTDNVTFTVNNGSLAQLPAGPIGFAGVGEWGTQYYGLKPDPLSLDGSYYGLHNTGAVGSRNHYGAGAEFRVPVFSQLNLTAAGRYDSYRYSGTSAGKFTYNAGIEYRPISTLLLRGSVGTGFRAPDLSYLYAGLSGSSSDGTDYYLCRRDEPSSGPDYFDNCSNGDVDFNGRSHGSTQLKDETSTSFTYGFVFAPIKSVTVAMDYYKITLRNEVEYQSSDTILREEADCRLGKTLGGAPVDANSTLCQEVEGQVVRNSPTAFSNPSAITSVLVLPINAALEETSGVDLSAHWRIDANRLGFFDFNAGFTDVLTHTVQLFPGDPVDNELTDWYNYVIPRNKATYSGAWTIGPVTTTVHGSRIGGLPNYDGTQRLGATSVYNASVNYRFAPRATFTFVVDNLFDTNPYRDSTWTSYPYYPTAWFSPVGRAFFAEINVKIGGSEP
ncbi:MAG TPA: TonB-dependent receptor [Steroidobacteraceae bacterium]|jgi:outer membrane receptor protein involved in Fe transport|nr:TonB-dependent receptor [Steroidobacteraceae bacterium]